MAIKKNVPNATTWKTKAPMRRSRPALIELMEVEFYTDGLLVVVAMGGKNFNSPRN
jgi:hypothetical protein